ncbi:MAG: malectin domain-containing carbohydrate-binding protein [Phycisphaerae bacterium]
MRRFQIRVALAFALVAAAAGRSEAACIEAFRLNAGGPAYTDTSGNLWTSDTGFFSGNTNSGTPSRCTGIAGTDDDVLYQTERWSEHETGMTYSFPVAPGTYRVRLHFAEIFWEVLGRRVFDVAIEGQPALSAYDIVAGAGANCTADIQEFIVQVSDDTLEIAFSSLDPPANDHPKVSAIEVIQIPMPPVIQEGDATSMIVQKNSPCPDAANELDLTASDSDTDPAALVWSIVTPPVRGTAGFLLGANTGAAVTLCYEPDADQAGGDSLILRVEDDCGEADEIAVTITINNSPPVIAQADRQVLAVQHRSLCPDLENQLALSANDADDDDATLIWQVRPGHEPATGTITFPGGNVGPAVTLCYQPNENPLASDTIVVEVLDPTGGRDQVTIDITVNGVAAPTIQCPPDIAVTAGDSLDPLDTGTATATDDIDASPLVTFSDAIEAAPCPLVQVITRTWTATDTPGNAGHCTQRIVIRSPDTDGDGIADCADHCAGLDDRADSDGDGVLDCVDQCPGGDDTIDANGDGIPDCLQGAFESEPSVPSTDNINDCCGGGAPAVLPFMLTGYGWLRRHRRRRRR